MSEPREVRPAGDAHVSEYGPWATGADRTRIGILKSIGFGPGQVTAVYAGQSLVPAAVGCPGGVALANVLVRSLLARAAHSSGLLSVPAWVDVDVAVTI